MTRTNLLILLCLLAGAIQLILLLAAPARALAQDPQHITVYRLPQYHLCVEGTEQYACFGVNEFRSLLQIDTDLHTDEQLIQTLRASIINYEFIQTQLRDSLARTQNILGVYVDDRNRLFQLWSNENSQRHQLQERPLVGDWVAWAIVAVCGVIAVGLGVTLAVVAAHP